MKLSTLMRSDIDELYSNFDFLNDVLLYADYYKKNFTDKPLNVTPADAYTYQGNLFGLFTKMGLPDYLHLPVMAYNAITSPVEYDGTITTFYMPSQDIYNRLHNLN